MSRVAYPGFRSGFPFVWKNFAGLPSPPASMFDPCPGDLNPTSFPVESTLADASKWFWRVKEWKVEWDDELGGVSGGGEAVYGWRKKTVGGHEYNEAGLVTFPNGWELYTVSSSTYGSPSTGPLGFWVLPGNACGTGDGSLTYPAGVKVSDSAYRLGMTLVISDATSHPLSSIQVSGDNALQVRATATVAGFSVPLYNTLGSYEYFSTSYDHGTYTVTPHKYWSYDGLYDETTGALL